MSETLQKEESRPVALVTGSSQRLGAHIVSMLHARNMRVIVHYHNSETSAHALCDMLESKRLGSTLRIAANLASPEAPRQIVDFITSRWGRLDVVVNNASVYYPSPLASSTMSDWDDMSAVNLRAPYFLCKEALPLLEVQGGNILNLVDIYAERPRPDYAIYCATKAGLVAMTRALARELAPKIRVNAIAPGAILWSSETTSLDQEKILASVPLGRLGSVEDISRAVLYLLDAPYVTGQVINVDGGRSISN